MKKYSNKYALLVFVKNAELGRVKTRLAQSIGDTNALTVYRALIEKTKEIIEPINAQKVIYYSDYIDEYDQFPEKVFSKRLQMGDDLGERMKNAFESAFNVGFEKVVIIGSDCWELDSETIEIAFDSLNESDVVIGPAYDGGYYLLGMKKLNSEIFANKEWSTENVLVDTLLDVEKSGCTIRLLQTLSDVDYAEDLPDELKLILD